MYMFARLGIILDIMCLTNSKIHNNVIGPLCYKMPHSLTIYGLLIVAFQLTFRFSN